MTEVLKCISPIDGAVLVERPLLGLEQAKAAAARAKAAQLAWAARPLQERIDLVLAAVAAIGEMDDQIVPELAQQMGRPVRYGGEFSGFQERIFRLSGPRPLYGRDCRTGAGSDAG